MIADRFLMMGELGLDGTIRAVSGALPTAELSARKGFSGCILPKESAIEAAEYHLGRIYGVDSLEDVIHILKGEDRDRWLTYASGEYSCHTVSEGGPGVADIMDFADIAGQENAKRGLEIAAAGGHNVLLIGPPGSGKSSLAKATSRILPPMTPEEALQTSKIYSVAGKSSLRNGKTWDRPFRSPHYSASVSALIGGGSDNIMPGEISLAHNGVLFLDELPEFTRATLEVLRQPLEDRKISICRARMRVEYPAGFMLVASMNPCPCGYYNAPDKECTCKASDISRYLNKISGPLLDRMDLHVQVLPVPYHELSLPVYAESSAEIRKRVIKARELQLERFSGSALFCNAQMQSRHIRQYCQLEKDSESLLKDAMSRYGLSARAYHRILKVARTIADLEGSPSIRMPHVAEAVQYRCVDRANWGQR